MSDESIASSFDTSATLDTYDLFSGSTFDPETGSLSSVESAEMSVPDSLFNTALKIDTVFRDKANEIAMLKLENFYLKLKSDTDDVEIALLQLEYQFDMLELKLYAQFGFEL